MCKWTKSKGRSNFWRCPPATESTFYRMCFVLPSKGNSFCFTHHAVKEDIFVIHGCTHHWYITVFQQRPRVWLKITAIFVLLQYQEKRQCCSKVKTRLWGHSSPKVHDGNCWQKKVTVTVKDLSIKTWCLLHFLQASMGFVTDQD